MSNSPRVSIILPIYNAERFLRQGIDCVRSQSFSDWELIAVDDGSSDNSSEVLRELTEGMPQPLVFITQENKGGFGARNTGLDHASGEYIAFFDIDDLWYPNHLESCVNALDTDSELDWVWGPNRILNVDTGELMHESTFYQNKTPRPVLGLKTRRSGEVNIIEDPKAIECQALHGLYLGQQFSLSRKAIWENYRFKSSYRNEGADQISVIRALSEGYTLGYFDELHGDYAVHGGNASAGCVGAPLEKYLRLRRALVQGFEEAKTELNLSAEDKKALDKRIAGEQFWQIGYNLLWKNGKTTEALDSFRDAIKRHPWCFRFWKTYLLALIKVNLGIHKTTS